jgi:hypothetical protein
MRQVTDLNWQYESAMAVRALNSRLKELRKENPKFMDPHTNVEQIPLLYQPTRCEVQAVSDACPSDSANHVRTDDTASGPVPTALSIPRSIGPLVDTAVKIDIRAGAPPPPFIHDPGLWAVIPEDIRNALDEAELSARPMFDEDENHTRYPISLISGQYQSAYPM